ncbi:molybdate ABC transporter substrate-binding protein [Phyllobacterium sp. 0TCS1.6A]|uniref:molybdate ABC transporter substrate-binding protein n=1 Tax=unclassified Phyllobacterium TaxID=2638441 RepID=UPI003A5C2DA2
MRMIGLKKLGGVMAVICLMFSSAAAPVRAEEAVTVFAAASLKNAMDDVVAAWMKESGKQAVASYASSSALAKQIEAGAPADIFISADLEWMDYLANKNLIKPASRSNLLGNRLVLVAPEGQAEPIEMKQGLDLARLLDGGRLAMGEINTVPAGKYGKEALQSLGIWPSVANSIAGAENVRAALLLVARGEAPYGIVYETDAAADSKVEIVATFPEASHKPIVYPVALLAESDDREAESLLAFMKSERAAPFFRKHGFTVLTPAT